MDTLFDLPAHALLIHAPIVLLPLAAIGAVVLACRPAWRRSVGWWSVAAVALIALLLYLAKTSGESLDAAFAGAVDVSTHEQLANTTFVLSLVWLALTVAVVLLDRRLLGVDRPTLRSEPPALLVASAAWVVVAVLATVWLVRTGHEGSRVVWEPTMDFLDF